MSILPTSGLSPPGPLRPLRQVPQSEHALLPNPCHHTHQISQVRLLAPHEGPVFAHSCHPLIGSLIEILTHVVLEVVPGQG